MKIICISYQYVFFFITLIPTTNERQIECFSFETNLHFLYTASCQVENFGEELETARRTDRQSLTMGNQKNSIKPYKLMWAF